MIGATSRGYASEKLHTPQKRALASGVRFPVEGHADDPLRLYKCPTQVLPADGLDHTSSVAETPA